MNQVILLGNVGADPELIHTESGKVKCKFSLATNSSYKNKMGEWVNEVEWHTCVAWNTRAESIARRVQKGTKVLVQGKIEYYKTEDRTYCQILVNQIRIV